MAPVLQEHAERWTSPEGRSAHPGSHALGERQGSSLRVGELKDPGGVAGSWTGRMVREGCVFDTAASEATTGVGEGVLSLNDLSLFDGRGGEAEMTRQTSHSCPPSRPYTEPRFAESGEVLLEKAVSEAGTRSFPTRGALARRRGFVGSGIQLRMPGPVQGWREVLCARGYRVDGVIGRSRANRGFSVVLVRKGGQSFAAKGTNEAIQDGILNTTLQREYRVLRRLCHPGVVRAESLIHTARGRAIVMEYCPGRELASLLPRHSRLSEKGRYSVLEGVLDAVSYLHAQWVAHRDLHGHNVMVDCGEPGAGSSVDAQGVRIVDFGSAQDMAVEAHGGVSELADLTSEILPPEVSLGLACPFGCDVFAAGLLAASLCAGQVVVTKDVANEGLLEGAGDFLRLSTAGQAHLRSMLAPQPDDRPAARESYERLPPVAAFFAA
ncbi:unnamed protein product [Prorocentrum cordatum]|uniref:Protein kinase domain-containing protein n=1 Tax=Prorocentrum cordatum TaxID=2364126 RepID=A0ABN9X5Z0_9DINO|nr:unnamed protein product [Polarella glacialis]